LVYGACHSTVSLSANVLLQELCSVRFGPSKAGGSKSPASPTRAGYKSRIAFFGVGKKNTDEFEIDLVGVFGPCEPPGGKLIDADCDVFCVNRTLVTAEEIQRQNSELGGGCQGVSPGITLD